MLAFWRVLPDHMRKICIMGYIMMDFMLDSFDHAILKALSRDGGLTNAELSESVGLSASQCSRRRNRLEAEGVIKGYRACLNQKALGLDLRAVTRVNLSAHGERAATDFERFVTLNDEIEAAYSVSGDADYVLLIVTENLSAYADFVHTRLLPFPNITQIRSDIVLKTMKEVV